MKIESIEASNLKVPSFKHDLGAVTVLTGGNAVGKSARLEAIRLGLLGWVPGLPKTNAGIFSLSCGATMGVNLHLSDGTTITRSYSQKGETVKAVENANGFEVPTVLMDAAEYLRLSDRERIKYVFSLVDIGDKWTGENILRAIGETPIDCEHEIIEDVVLAKREIFARLSQSDHDRHDQDGSVQDWLETVLADLRERVKNTNAALGRMEKFSQASVELKAADSGLDAANVDRLLKEKRTALQEAVSALAVAKSKQDQAAKNSAMRRELERRLAEPFDAAAIEATRKQIQDIESAAVEGVDLGDMAFKVAEARGQLEAAKNRQKQIASQIEGLEVKHAMDLKAPKCPHCGTKGKKFIEAVTELYEQRKTELAAEKVKTEQAIERAQSDYKTVQDTYEQAAIASKKAERDRMLVVSLKGELNRLETLSINRVGWQKQLADIPVEDVEAGTIETMTRDVRAFESEVADLADRQKRWIAATQDAKRLADAKAKRQKDEAELVALKAIVKSVEVIQAVIVADAFGKILADANRFCADILLTPLAYHEGELGRWSKAKPSYYESAVWIPHRSFSGTESLISCAGISVALARQSPVKVVLLDELGRLTAANKRRLVDRLLTLTAEGFIDQVCAVDVDASPYRGIEGVQLIEVT